MDEIAIFREAQQTLDGTLSTRQEKHGPEEGYALSEDMALFTHRQRQCLGGFCSVHNPSDHPLRDALRHWDDSTGSMRRECTHGSVHPDVDDLAFKLRTRGEDAYEVYREHPCCPERCCGIRQHDVLYGEVVSERLELER